MATITVAGKKIKDLPEVDTLNDSDDIIVENEEPKTQRTKWGTIWGLIKSKFELWEFGLKTKNKTVPKAINELSDKMTNTSTRKSYVENGIAWDIYTIIHNDFAIVTAKAALQRIPITTAWGSGVYASSDINTDFTFPIPFREAPAVQVTTTNYGNNAWPIVTTGVTATKAPKIQLCRGSAITEGTARIYIQCIGLVDYHEQEK